MASAWGGLCRVLTQEDDLGQIITLVCASAVQKFELIYDMLTNCLTSMVHINRLYVFRKSIVHELGAASVQP